MKNKKHGLFFGFAVILAAAIFSISLAGCPTDSDDGDDPNTLTITGITGVTETKLTASLSEDGYSLIAAGVGDISNGTAVIQLKKTTDGGGIGKDPWAGTGNFTIVLWKSNDGSWKGSPHYTSKAKITIQKGNTDVKWDEFK